MKPWDEAKKPPLACETPGHKNSNANQKDKMKAKEPTQAGMSEDQETEAYDYLRALDNKWTATPEEHEKTRCYIEEQIIQKCAEIGNNLCQNHYRFYYFYEKHVNKSITTDDISESEIYLDE